jgi:hypothetical protein
MKLLACALGAALLAAPQEGDPEALILKLDDDAVDARAEALNALVRLGRRAVPALEKARVGASPDLRERIAEILRKIEERERLGALLRPASRITLEARGRPLREVLAALQKQAPTPVDAEGVPEGEKVTVSLSKTPFWEALEAICRANGNVMPELQTDRVAVASEKYAALPRRLKGAFAVHLLWMEMTSGGSLDGQERYEEFRGEVRVCWEKGVRPWRVTTRLAELTDDRGESLISEDDEDRLVNSVHVSGDGLGQDLAVGASRVPRADAATLGRLKIEVEIEFALRYSGVAFANPDGKVGASARCRELSATVVKWTRTEKEIVATLRIQPQEGEFEEFSPEQVCLKDKAGKEHPGLLQSMGDSADEQGVLYQFSFPVPVETEIQELAIRVPAEIHKERVDLDLRDVPLR